MGEKIVGIMGGMGPEATVDLFRKILAATPAKSDQEHLHILIDCNSKIPSRPKALLEGGPDPTPLLQSTARNLELAGADFLVVACNTAHLFYDRIVEAVRVPVLHIADEAIGEAQRRYPGLRSVGVLAGRGAIRPGERVVVISTAHGLKFPDFKVRYHDGALAGVKSALRNPAIPVRASVGAVQDAIAARFGRG